MLVLYTLACNTLPDVDPTDNNTKTKGIFITTNNRYSTTMLYSVSKTLGSLISCEASYSLYSNSQGATPKVDYDNYKVHTYSIICTLLVHVGIWKLHVIRS